MIQCPDFRTFNYPEFRAKFGASVPDYRGMFLRGYGSQSFKQTNGWRYGSTSTNHSSGGLGAVQGNAMRPIEGWFAHAVIGWDHFNEVNSLDTGSFEPQASNLNKTASFVLQGDTANRQNMRSVAWGINSGWTTPVATETRPVNRAVKYAIKAR